MIGLIRQKFGPKIIGGIIAVIAAVFVFYGIFTPGQGAQGPGSAGEVNGETISYSEYNRALNQRIEFFKNMMGGKISDEQLEQFHIREAVFQDLAQRKLLGQIAKKEGFYPSAEQIRDQILKMDVFKKDGRFDKVLYKNVLTQNQYTPTAFEALIGADIMEQNFRSFLSSLAFVSPNDVEKELRAAKDKRKMKYVFLDNESLRKTLSKDLAKDSKPADQSKKLDEQMEKFSKEILPALSANQDAKVNTILKDANVKVKTSDWLSAQSEVIPGVGSIRMIQAELSTQKKGEPAKRYTLMGGTLFASIVDQESYDPAKVTPKERTEMASRLQNQKQSEILSEFMKTWMKKASISRNDKLVATGKGKPMPVMPTDDN